MMPDIKPLLLSNRIQNLLREPFYTFQVNDFLPIDVYQSLWSSFPDNSWCIGENEGNTKRSLSSKRHSDLFQEFCATYPDWQALCALFSSHTFVDNAIQLFREALFQSYGKISQSLSVQFEFSRMPRDSFLEPHTDLPYKMITLLLYFPEPEWQDSYGGHTEFYRSKDPAMASNWWNRIVPFDQVEVFRRAHFIPNQLIGFIKSDNSLHGVPPITCPVEMNRKSLNVHIIDLNSLAERLTKNTLS